MKKFFGTALIAVILTSMFLVSCKQPTNDEITNPNAALYGTWNVAEYKTMVLPDGNSSASVTMDASYNIATNTYTFSLNVISYSANASDEFKNKYTSYIETGTYQLTDSTIKFEHDTTTYNYAINGNSLTLSVENESTNYIRQ